MPFGIFIIDSCMPKGIRSFYPMGKQFNQEDNTAPLLAYSLYRGLQTRVANRLGVSRSMVSQVAKGQKRSKRIEKALLSEARKIERSISKGRVGMEAA
jgi:transcriptional regulator with XRE-family HTH domain